MENKDLSHLLHDSQVDKLFWRLQHKDRYFAVAKEVPLWKKSMFGKKGQADVLTIDKVNNRIIYWEVKTGQSYKAIRKAKKQASRFHSHMSNHPLYSQWDSQFIYYNPIKEEIKRI